MLQSHLCLVLMFLGHSGLMAQGFPPGRVEQWRRTVVRSRRRMARGGVPGKSGRAVEAALRWRKGGAAGRHEHGRKDDRWGRKGRAPQDRVMGRLLALRRVPAGPVSLVHRASRARHARVARSVEAGALMTGARVAAGPSLSLSGAACLAALRRVGVRFEPLGPLRGVQTPVRVTGPMGGVRWVPVWGHRPAVMDCRFALTLYRLGPLFRAAGFDEARYSSFYVYRNVAGTHRLSRHANGLAVDLHELRGPGGLRARVARDWQRADLPPGTSWQQGPRLLCGRGTRFGSLAARLRRLVCALEASGLLYLVLTPDSDRAHWNHFHLSGLRPGNHPLRHRYAGLRLR